jgi:hypothetical protein
VNAPIFSHEKKHIPQDMQRSSSPATIVFFITVVAVVLSYVGLVHNQKAFPGDPRDQDSIDNPEELDGEYVITLNM